jgi:hypothetical protein
LSHLFLFLGRLAFIFGGSLFGVVFFRHLPEINHGADLWLMFLRAIALLDLDQGWRRNLPTGHFRSSKSMSLQCQ